MKVSSFLCLGAIAIFFLSSLPGNVIADRAMSRAKLEKEVKSLRETVHDANCELAQKSDRIAELEAELKKLGLSQEEVTSTKASPKQKSTAKKNDKSPSVAEMAAKGDSCKDACEEGTQASDCDSKCEEGGSFAAIKIRYEKNSAVNYDGREKVLNFVKEQLEQNPVTLFSVFATANDSAFETKDRDIAMNRARFLVDYLTICGISDEVFVRVEGDVSLKEGAEGRSALILVESK